MIVDVTFPDLLPSWSFARSKLAKTSFAPYVRILVPRLKYTLTVVIVEEVPMFNWETPLTPFVAIGVISQTSSLANMEIPG